MSRVGLVGAHDPDYPRTQAVRSALVEAGHEVVDRGRKGERAVSRIIGAAVAAWRSGVDVVWVTHPGYAYVVPAWLAARLRRRPIVFDAFVSLVETRFDERRDRPAWQRRIAEAVEGFALRRCDRVVFDTTENLDWAASRFSVEPRRFRVVPVTLDPPAIGVRSPAPAEPPSVLWYGKFAPLHGVETILAAARRVGERAPAVTFTLIGDPASAASWKPDLVDDLPPNCRLVPPVAYDRLGSYLASAAVVLGVFGTTPKADRVVPNKVVEALAAGRPLVTADTTALRRIVGNSGEAVVLVDPGDAEALADAIVRTVADRDRCTRLAEAGLRVHADRLSPAAAAVAVADVLAGLEDRVT